MPLVAAYHRPRTIEEALSLLRSPRRIPLAGGTTLNADRAPSDLEAVDLQALGIDEIVTEDGGLVCVGAAATLDAMRRCEALPASLRDAARAEQPSTLRTLATVGGLISKSPPESLTLAALLAHDSVVEISVPSEAQPLCAAPPGAESVSRNWRPLAEMLATGVTRGALITALRVDPRGLTATSATARTPADTPIVAAYARRADGSDRLALSGVARHPVLVDPDDPLSGLDPPGDFRGSRAYRLHLAGLLARRALEGLTP